MMDWRLKKMIRQEQIRHTCKTISILLLVLGSLAIHTGCAFRQDLPGCRNPEKCERIKIAPGPEDFVLDKWHKAPRMLVSCSERRAEKQTGDIYAFNPQTLKIQKMPRTGDKNAFKNFAPHGVDIRHDGRQTILYAILHDPHDTGKRSRNAIAQYRVLEDHLEFIPPLLENETHLWSPNDLSVMDNGEIYVTNDFKSLLHVALKLKTSDIVHFDPKTRQWKKVGPKIGFANGILAQKERVYVCASKEDRLYRFERRPDGNLENPKVAAEIRGPDNIMVFNDKLLIAAHFNDVAFFFHIRSQKNISPTVIYMIDPVKKTKEVIYADNGSNYSAASSAFIFNNRLILSQVFNSFLLVCDLDESGSHTF